MTIRHRRLTAIITPLLGLVLIAPTAPAHAVIGVPAVDPTAAWSIPRDDYTGHVQVVRGPAADPAVLTGTVFTDTNRNSVKDALEPGVAGVLVSNGRDVVTTDLLGRYSLPAFDRMSVFVTQPAGYAVPVNQDNVAQFSYQHFPNGSPELEAGGIAPTGPLPKAVNFPMVISPATGRINQNCAAGADSDIVDDTTAATVRQGTARDIVARKDIGGCGLMLLGDSATPELLRTVKDLYRQVRGPLRLIPGQGEQDHAGTTTLRDTFRAEIGPSYFSYEVGRAHIVGLDNANRLVRRGNLESTVDDEQLAWLAKDLAHVPAGKLVIVYAAVPFLDRSLEVSDDTARVFATLTAAGRTAGNTLLVGGHNHTLENHLAKAGGEHPVAFPQLSAGSIAGSWSQAPLDEFGLPIAYAADGTRPGHLNLALVGNEYVESYQVRQQPWQHRLSVGVNSPTWRTWANDTLMWYFNHNKAGHGNEPKPVEPDLNVVSQADLASNQTWINANFYLGSAADRVEMAIDNRAAQPAERSYRDGSWVNDGNGWDLADVPAFAADLRIDALSFRRHVKYPHSTSVWRLPVPTDLGRGTHTVRITATDRFGRRYAETLLFHVA